MIPIIGRDAEILIGKHEGKLAHITWVDEEFVRVTPIDGDPLLSLQFRHNEIEVIDMS